MESESTSKAQQSATNLNNSRKYAQLRGVSGNTLFEEFLSKCEGVIKPSVDPRRGIEKIRKRFDQVDVLYKDSQSFISFLQNIIPRVMAEPWQCMESVADMLKRHPARKSITRSTDSSANAHHSSQSSIPDEKTQRPKLGRKIQSLEEAEVDLQDSDEENSSYMQVSRIDKDEMAERITSTVKSVAGSSSSRKRKHSTSGEESVTLSPDVGPSTIEAHKGGLKMNKLQKKVGSGGAGGESGGTGMTILNLLNMLVSPREIMRFLPLADHKRCRLTCKEWYKLCAVYEDQEKICIPSAFNNTLNSVLSVLVKSNRSCLHLEFYAINFMKKARKVFWRACGPKIQSLKMINCNTTNAVMGGIIAHCSNLRELEFYFNDIGHMRYEIMIAYPSRAIPDGSRNESLRTLKIHFTSNKDTDQTLHWLKTLDQLFLLFPNISNFLFWHCNLKDEELSGLTESDSRLLDYYKRLPTEEKSRHESISSSLHKCFVRDQMESIALSFVWYPWLDWTLLSDVKGLTKITEIALDPENEGVEYLQKFLKFASHQVHLQKIRCISRKEMSDEMVELLMSLVSKIPALRTLCLFLEKNVITWKNEWSKILSSSRLKILQISCIELSCPANVGNSICTTLTGLLLDGDELNVVPLLKSFPNLKTLTLNFADNETLECIGSHQLGLESLWVGHVGEDNTDGPQSSGAINKLKQLKYLDMPNFMDLNPENLPCLKFLRVFEEDTEGADDDESPFDMDHFYKYLAECPSLEVVYIDCCIFVSRLWDHRSKYREWFVEKVTHMIKGAGYLKVLFLEFNSYFQYKRIDWYKHFCFESNDDDEEDSAEDEDPSEEDEDPDNMWDLTVKDVVPIFEACPTLRVLIHASIFVKDGVTGCIKKQLRDHLGGNEFLIMFGNNYQKCTKAGFYFPPVKYVSKMRKF